MFPDIRKDDLTGFLALLAMLATSSKGIHFTSAPSNNFSKKVRLFFIVFLSLLVGWALAHRLLS